MTFSHLQARLVILVSLAVITLLVLAGCGNSTKGASSGTTAAPVPTAPAAAAATSATATTTVTGSATNAVTATSSPATETAPATATTSSNSTAAGDPCSLLTDADVAKLSPGVGHGTTQTVAGVTKICEWSTSNGLPSVQLQVASAGASSVKDDLNSQLAFTGGYDIVAVNGIGDEAAAAFQKADASKGLKAGMAIFSARKGNQVVSISTPYLTITQGSQQFMVAKNLMTTALSHLGSGG